MKHISILGSTGSIGTQTLEVVRANPDRLRVCALTAGRNIDLLERQIREFRPSLAAIMGEDDAEELRRRTAGLDVQIVSGMDGLIEAARVPEAQIVVTAIVGMIGIRPTIAAIEAGKDIALANKETLVTAGHIIMPLARGKNVRILPVDSEHSAIFQCLNGERGNKIARIWLTASGGPFRGRKQEELKNIRVEDALRHPNWSMGRKITIDSATLVNKGLEVMEASHLFGVAQEKVKVVLQPQSVIHSMVEYEDGAVIAQLGTPDMKLPIQYALLGPERLPLSGDRLDFAALGSLTFEEPDHEALPGLAMAREAFARGGNIPTVFNAANECAVALFLNRKIPFLTIYSIIGECMERIPRVPSPTVEQILETETAVRRYISDKYGTSV